MFALCPSVPVCSGVAAGDPRVAVSTEQQITPEQFAEILCADMDLSPMHFVQAIASTIRQQTEAFPLEMEVDDELPSDQRVILKVVGSK